MLSALMFFPRGGSAHVARALAEELPAHGWDVTVVSGSLGGRGCGDAERFYAGLDVHAGATSTAGDAPMHPSYEDRPDAPDRVFAAVDDDDYERHVAAWSRALEEAGAADADVLHLHHLTPIHEAAARVAPDVPVVGHLHGTELLMLERDRRRPAARRGPRRGVGAADAPLGARLRAPARALAAASSSAPSALLGIDAGPLRRGPQRLRPRALRAADGRPRGPLARRTSSTTRTAGGRATTRARSRYRPETRPPWPATRS